MQRTVKKAAVLIPVIERQGRAFILLTKRTEHLSSHSGQIAFPGGKIETGETPEDALVRELNEELSIEPKPACLAPLSFASHAYEDFHLLMPLYICRRWWGIPVPREGQEVKWVRANRLREFPMPPADEPLIPALIDIL
ncbi:MAG: (deoxy)nucleoside triphosphate pyrophosphohydrolase [Devosiaceae bacterium]|nr:(deoxy)nucleoside triphosphate pyrophosphohydrolase [Devosiaceae bacterium]